MKKLSARNHRSQSIVNGLTHVMPPVALMFFAHVTAEPDEATRRRQGRGKRVRESCTSNSREARKKEKDDSGLGAWRSYANEHTHGPLGVRTILTMVLEESSTFVSCLHKQIPFASILVNVRKQSLRTHRYRPI